MINHFFQISAVALSVFAGSSALAKTQNLPTEPISKLAFYDGEKVLTSTDAWSMQGEDLVCSGDPRGYLILAEDVSDYTLTLDWKWDNDAGGNSGVLIHAVPATSGFRTWPSSIEVQLQKDMAGDIYAIGNMPGFTGQGGVFVAPGVPVTRLDRITTADNPVGDWNTLEIVASGETVTVKVNDQLVSEISRVKPNQGAIALQSEGAPIRFRNIQLKQ